MKKTVMSIKAFITACMFLCATASLAADGFWNGTGSAFWTNSANWSASPYPSGANTATFINAAAGRETMINLQGLSNIKSITFDTASVAAYTNGTGAANSQTLTMLDGEIKLSSTAANSQVFNCGVQLGTNRNAQAYSFRNDNPLQTLTFNNVFGSSTATVTAGAKTLTINGTGPVEILGNIVTNAVGLVLTDANSGTLKLLGSNIVTTLNINGAASSVVDIGSGYLALENGGGNILTSSQGGTINGTGTIRLSTGTGTDYGNVKPATTKTLVINPSIISTGGFELNDTGTAVLNGNNTFAGEVSFTAAGTLSVSKIGNKGALNSNLGAGTKIIQTVDNARLLYTGNGETTDRIIELSKSLILDHSGTNLLKFTSDLLVSGTGNKQLKLQGATVSTGEVAGVINNGTGGVAVDLNKDGINSTWLLSNTNLFTGGVNINAGNLVITKSTSLGVGNKTVTISNGTTGNPQLHLDGSAGSITLGANLTFQTSCINGAIKNIAGTNTINALKINLTGGGGDTTVESLAGKLALAGRITTDYGSLRSLRLRGNADGEVSGNIDNGNATVGLYREFGAGTWTLSGTNTYTGATTVNSGKLLVNSSTAAGSAVTVNGGGTLGGLGTINGTVSVTLGGCLTAGGINTTGTLSLANNSAASLTLNGGTLLFDLPATGTACDKIDITGGSGKLVLNGANTVALSFPYGPAPAGTYTLMTCSGGITTNAGASLALQGSYPNASLSVVGNDVVLTVEEGGTFGLTWQGNLSDVWDGVALNWTNGSAAVAFTNGQSVLFDDTALGFTVSSGEPVLPASVQINNSANDYTVSAVIDGTTSLTKLGSGSLTLSGINTYTGPTIIGGGTVTIGGTGLLGNGVYATNILNNGGGALTFASSAEQTLIGVLSGSGELVKTGSGTLILSAANTYAGTTTVKNGGSLKIQNGTALGATGSGTAVTNATLELAGNITTAAEGLTLYGTLSSQAGTNTYAGVVNAQTGASFDVASGSILNLSASIIGAAPFTKTGGGALRFTLDPNNTGAMTINQGVAEITAGTTDGNIIINSGATFIAAAGAVNDANSITANAGGTYDFRGADAISSLNGSGLVTKGIAGLSTLTVGGNNGSGTFSGVVENGVGQIAIAKNGTGTQTFLGTNTYNGATTVTAGTLVIGGAGKLGGGVYTATFANAGLFNYASSEQQTLSGVISGAGTIIKTGSGTLTLTAVNTFSGPITNNNGLLVGVTSGTCSNSSIIVQSVGSGVTASLGVRYTSANTQWACTNLMTLAAISSGNAPTLVFAFESSPSTTVGPLLIKNNIALDATTTISVDPVNLVSGGVYPLLTYGGTLTGTAPTTATIGRGLTGTLAWGTGSPYSTKTLVLTVSGTLADTDAIRWSGAAGTGTWDINNSVNTNWNDSTMPMPVSTYYQQTILGNPVQFEDSQVTADQTVTLDSLVTPLSFIVNNSLYRYTLSGSGAIGGATGLTKLGTNTVTIGTANTYYGMTTVNEGSLGLSGLGTLGRESSLTLSGGMVDLGGLSASVGTVNILGAPVSSNILQNGTLSGSSYVASLPSGTATVTANLLSTGNLTKAGEGTLVLAGTNNFTGTVTLNGGALTLDTTSATVSGAITVKSNGMLTISGPTSIGANTLTLGNAAGERAMAVISADATMGKLLASFTTAGSAGSVIQHSGTVLVGTTTTGVDVLSLGSSGGYGYYRKNGGDLQTGQLAITSSINNSGNTGVFDLFGGRVDVVPASGWLIFGWGAGQGVFNIFGGSLYSPPGGNDATLGYSGNSNFGMLNVLGSGALLDVTGKGIVRALNLARSAGNKASVLNLNAGVCLANRIWAQNTATPTFVNFDGGTLKANTSAANFLQGISFATIYPGGAVIDTTNSITIAQNLLAPTGYGVDSIPLLSMGDGYIGAPVVMISGGSGTGVTAIASVDLTDGSPTKGTLTGITMTSKGTGYQPTDELSVSLIGGGFTTAAVTGACTFAVNSATGGITKIGSGTLTLSGINTYGGFTVINNGKLLGATGASCSNSAVSVAATEGNSALFGVSITDNTKQWTCASLTVTNNGISSDLEFDFGTVLPSTALAPLNVLGETAFDTLPAVTVRIGVNSIGAPGTQYPLMVWDSTTGTAPTAVTVISLRAITGHLEVIGKTLTLVVDSNQPITWALSSAGIWDTIATNWVDVADAATTYRQTVTPGDHVMFNDNAHIAAHTTVTLNSTVSPANVTVSNTLYNYTISGTGAIAGTASLTKMGAGVLTLNTVNTYTGPTFINNGKLVGVTGGSITSVVTNNAADGNSIFGVRITDNLKQWSCNGLTFTSANTGLDFEFDPFVVPATTTNYAPLKVKGVVDFTSIPAVTVSGGVIGGTNSVYPLMVCTSIVGTLPTAVTVASSRGAVTARLTVTDGNTLNLVIETNRGQLTWAASEAGTWDTITNTWKIFTGESAVYSEDPLPGDQVFFDDTYVSADTTVTLNSVVTPAGVNAANAANNYVLSGSGSITGGARLNKSGSGIFTLGTANTYSGGTYLSDGILALGNSSALPVGSILSMSGAGTLDLNGYGATIGNIPTSTTGNTITDNSSGTDTNTLSILNQPALTISALIKDGATKKLAVNLANNNVGAPTPFLLTAASTYSGGLTLKNTVAGTRLIINGAVSTVGTPGNITSSPFGRGPIIIGEAATDKAGLYITTATTIANHLIVNTPLGTDQPYAIRVDVNGMILSGKVTANANLTMASYNTGSVTLTNEISGAGGVTMSAGNGTLAATLTGPNTYLGKTVVNKGTLSFSSIGNVGGGASALGAPTTIANGTIDLNADMKYNGPATSSDRVLNLTGGNGRLYNDGAGLLTLAGGITGNNQNFVFRGAGPITVSGAISTGSGSLARTDVGTLTLSNPLNSFSGTLIVMDGVISSDTIANSGVPCGLGQGTTIQLGQDSGTIGTLRFTGAGGGSCNRAFVIYGTSATAGGIIENTVSGQTLTLSGNISKGGTGAAPRLQLIGAGNGVLSGNIISNTLSVLKSGAGKWMFTGINSYTGATTVAGGTLVLSGANGLITNSLSYAINSGAMLVLENTAAANNTNRLRDASAITLDNGTLCFTNTAGAASYYENAGALFVTNSGGTIVSAQAATGRTNILSLGALTRTGTAPLNFVGTGIGQSDRNRIFIAGQPNGFIGFWATINTTNYAAYDSNLGVILAGTGATFTNILAKGLSVIPDDPALNAWINEEGIGGGISLAAAVTNRIKTLVQNTDWLATVAMTNKTLLVNEVLVSTGNARSLTLGTATGEGAVTPLSPGGELLLTAVATNSLLTINAAISNNTTASTVTKLGVGTVNLAGTNIFTGNLNVNSGTLLASGSNALAGAVVNVGGVSGDATLKLSSGSSLVGSGSMTVGNVNNGNGAFYLSGGQVARTGADNDKNFAFGSATGGYGYFNMSAGTLTSQRIGLCIANNVGGTALARITGGIGTFNSWVLIGRAGGIGVMTIDNGGSVIQTGTANSLMFGYDNGRGELNMTGGLSDNPGKPLVVRNATGSGATGIVNVCSGTLIVQRFVNNSTAFLNFNGGLLKASGDSLTFLPANMTGVYVNGPFGANAGGANIDSANRSITFVAPLLAPAGNGVTAISLSSNGSGYIGEPYVSITGDGVGATAVANMEDDGTGKGTYKVASVTVTTPGVNYTFANVSFLKGGATAVAPAASATLGTTAPAGLTKLGLGTLTLSGTNTYAGATTISNGTLRLGIANALPTNAAVIVAGGFFDLGGSEVTNGPISLYSGGVYGGTLVSSGVTKLGSGTSTLGVALPPGPVVVSEGVLKLTKDLPGLYEGLITGNAFDITSPNPGTSVTNSTRMANLGTWPVTTATYIYTGYIWNRTGANAVWTFAKSFDDSTYLKIDNTVLINNGAWATIIATNVMMTPGPHRFEARFGQGTGGVGPANGWPIGFGYDKLGRGTTVAGNYQPVSDPGDGSLLTISAVATNQLGSASVTVNTNGALDLGGTISEIANLDGNGVVSNGTLIVTGEISPAGTNAIDVLTAKANTTLSGKLLVNVATDGTSDRLDVQGNLTLLSPTLEIVDLQGLSTIKVYTLATCSGSITGSFTSTNLSDRWAVRNTVDGKVQLYYKGGTMVRIM